MTLITDVIVLSRDRIRVRDRLSRLFESLSVWFSSRVLLIQLQYLHWQVTELRSMWEDLNSARPWDLSVESLRQVQVLRLVYKDAP